jgi:hypothetical protein
MFQISIFNNQEHQISVQVDPFACTYYLIPNDTITFLIQDCSEEHSITMEEFPNGFRVLTLETTLEYYVVRDGKKYHWKEYSGD